MLCCVQFLLLLFLHLLQFLLLLLQLLLLLHHLLHQLLHFMTSPLYLLLLSRQSFLHTIHVPLHRQISEILLFQLRTRRLHFLLLLLQLLAQCRSLLLFLLQRRQQTIHLSLLLLQLLVQRRHLLLHAIRHRHDLLRGRFAHLQLHAHTSNRLFSF